MKSDQLDPAFARMAGALYLTIALCGGFSIGYVPMQIVVSGDAAASASNLLGHAGLFKLGVLADSAVILCEIAITVILYQLFRRESPTIAMMSVIARSGMIFVMGINLMLWVMPYGLLTLPSDFSLAERQNLAQLFFDAHGLGIYAWQIFFGAHLLALGAMVLRSRAVPQILGWGLFVGAFGYLVQAFYELTFSSNTTLGYAIIGLLVIVTISEISFGLWLLIFAPRRASQTTTFKHA
ncbi:DUF4386 domain-containing protein [Yoonia sediminilitoris]|uniref:Uncharacterized protein DUF4386 n=1 Tax=Yoonia sediminilitoris TaxID=1286148 RepID=A0A2T6KEZ5_9RHOB|nr:DUF4386 domain-containing protein [Yoonia sediminilitoris]PUB13677.1 uncharacterized protein DUF4386 [Yoonia sediminilitoris]RCW94847.1 uncharacterized protein DUF4386 [Yoonia sediminilitoris]